jgi:environmental stress-induced protein Ves
MRIIRQSSFAAVPWKNGGGVTHEAIRVPPDGDSFHWRVSVAQIDASGPFSDFAAYNRFMVLLKGAGVVLKFSSRAGSATVGGPAPRVRELRSVGDMEEFDGGLATHCDLVNGRCVDLNLMVSKTLPAVRAHVEVLRQPWSPGLESAESMLVFPIDANVEVRSGGSTQLLEPWDLALISGREDRQVYIAAQEGGEAVGAVKVFLATLPG